MNLKEKFLKFHEENPKIYSEFKRYAIEICNASIFNNRNYVSADLIMHRVRWESFIKTTGKPYRINNDFIASFSRLFQEEFPNYKSLFRNRTTKIEKAEFENPAYV